METPVKFTSPFIALYDRYGITMFSAHLTLENAINDLEWQSDKGFLNEIAVIETETKKMAWFSDLMGEEACQKEVDKFVKGML